jgi:hypothetical protein
VIVDELPHEDIWRHWIEEDKEVVEMENDSYSTTKCNYKAKLFLHAKHPDRIKSSWVRAQTLGQ